MIINLKRSIGPASIMFLLAVMPLKAADDPASLPLVKSKVKTIAAFKNGLGFVFSSGEAQLKEGWTCLERLPAASLGTLWIAATSKANPVNEVLTYKQKVFEDSEALTQSELLAANVGKRLVITYNIAGTAKTVEGTLLAAPPDRRPEEAAILSASAPSYSSWRPPGEITRGEIILMRINTNERTTLLSLNKSSIQSVELPADSNTRTRIEKEVARAKLHVEGNPKSAEIALAYLEKGLVWSPSYRVNLANEQTADIALEAVLANDAEELENADVSFVVGYPNFLYADILSPLTSSQSVANFIQSLMSDRRPEQRGRFANVVSQQALAMNDANFDLSSRPETSYSATQSMTGETSEDLYFYHQASVTLRKGERARYVVLSASVPYEHLYQWEIPDSMNIDERGYRQNSNERGEPENQVWHVLRLENTTSQPWTTAPALTLNQAMPLAQDVLKYTPPGAKNTLKLTVATDLRADQSQTETARKPVSLEGRPFDEVSVTGKLKVTNWKNKETHVLVKKSLTGEVLNADSEGKVTKVARKLTSLNANSQIEWEFQLAAGKTKELSFQYKVMIYR